MNKLFLYIDNCCFNRPFDNQASLSIFLETQAKLMIQNLISDNMLNLVWSFILDFENGANPDESIKDEIFTWKTLSSVFVYFEKDILKYAKELIQLRFGKKDALHIASACKSNADFFITVDKGILKKADLIDDIKILNPIAFINYLEGKNEN